MDKNEEKWNFAREDKRKTRNRQNRKKTRILKTDLLGEQRIKNNLKLQENNLFGPFLQKNKNRERKKQKHQKQI